MADSDCTTGGGAPPPGRQPSRRQVLEAAFLYALQHWCAPQDKREEHMKNKTWQDSEEVLLRYFTGLRMRLQFEGGGYNALQQGAEEYEERPDPEDENPEVEEEACVRRAWESKHHSTRRTKLPTPTS